MLSWAVELDTTRSKNMAKDQRRPPITTERMLEWFRRSPMATELEREAREAKALHEARVRALEQWHEAEKRKAEIPPLEKDLEEARKHYREVHREASLRLSRSRKALDNTLREIRVAQSRAKVVLRDTDPIARDSGDVWYAIVQAREHVMGHSMVEADRLREELRAARRLGYEAGHPKITQLEQIVANIDAAQAVLPKFDAAIADLRSVQLEVAPDLPKIVDSALKDLPATCPVCAKRLRLHRIAADVLRRPRWERPETLDGSR